MIGENDWLIDSLPRLNAKPECQIIQIDHNACATCPLANKEPEESPSAFLRHLVYLAGLQEVGAQFAFDELTGMEWEGLRLLKRKRDEKQIKELKDKNKSITAPRNMLPDQRQS